jgi:hypothetical protein
MLLVKTSARPTAKQSSGSVTRDQKSPASAMQTIHQGEDYFGSEFLIHRRHSCFVIVSAQQPMAARQRNDQQRQTDGACLILQIYRDDLARQCDQRNR